MEGEAPPLLKDVAYPISYPRRLPSAYREIKSHAALGAEWLNRHGFDELAVRRALGKGNVPGRAVARHRLGLLLAELGLMGAKWEPLGQYYGVRGETLSVRAREALRDEWVFGAAGVADGERFRPAKVIGKSAVSMGRRSAAN